MNLPRPPRAPRRIPLWAWQLDEWMLNGRHGPRPRHAPKRPPAWFWLWRLFTLARARGKGTRAWKKYMAALRAGPDPQAHIDALRAAIVKWALYYAAHEPEVGYTQGSARDDFLGHPRGHLPQRTDCSGFTTECYWDSNAPDPSGLGYRWVGWTGTLLQHAYAVGRVFTDLSLARPGDPIVVGPGSGWHVFVCVEAGADPIVVSHGSSSGPKRYGALVDSRVPKRVCQTLI